jgi:hypothetical protein
MSSRSFYRIIQDISSDLQRAYYPIARFNYNVIHHDLQQTVSKKTVLWDLLVYSQSRLQNSVSNWF